MANTDSTGQKTMGTIIRSLLMIVAAAAIVGGVTYAEQHATKSIDNNTYTAGTMELKVGGVDTATLPFHIEGIMPGNSGSKTYYVKNVSSVKAQLSIEGFSLIDSDGVNTPDELLVDKDPTKGELSDNLIITITSGDSATPVYTGKLSAVVGVPVGQVLGSLDANEQRNFTVAWELPFATGDIVQGDRSTVNVKLMLTQQQ